MDRGTLVLFAGLAACRPATVVEAPRVVVEPAPAPAVPVPAAAPAIVEPVLEARVPAAVAWRGLAARDRLAAGELLALRRAGAPEPWGVAVVRWDRVDVYTPALAEPQVRATSATLGFPINATSEVEPRALAGLIVASAPGRTVALDAATLTRRWELALAGGGRLKGASEAGGWVILDRMHDRGAGVPGDQSVVAVDPRDGTIQWRVDGYVGAVDAAGDHIVTSRPTLAVRDARTGALRWQRDLDSEVAPAIGPTWIAIQEKDGGVRALAAADGADLGRGRIGELGGYDAWSGFSGGVIAGVARGRAPRLQERVVAWDPTTGREAWATAGHPVFVVGWAETRFQETRGELLVVDGHCGAVRVLERETHAERWSAGFDGLRAAVLANDGAAALYVASAHAIDVFVPAEPAPAERATIRGTVLFDGRPRAGADVRAGDVVVRSDARGRFTLTTAGRHGLVVEARSHGGRRPGCPPDAIRGEYVALTGAGAYTVELTLGSHCHD